MGVKVTIPNTGSDYLTFGSANTPVAAQIGGYDDGSSNGHLELYTTASGTSTERMRIDSAGNVGIGTSSPSGKLHVNQATAGSPAVYLQHGDGDFIQFAESGGTTLWKMSRNAGTNDLNINNVTANAIAFGTSNTERMRIDSSGNLLVGTTSAGAGERLAVTTTLADFMSRFYNAHASSPKGIVLNYSAASPNNTGNEFIYMTDNVGARAYFKSNGGLGNYQANNSNISDERTKTEIKNAGNYLEKICAIPVRTFLYKDQTDDLLNLGVIAQEVEAVAPELVDITGFGETPDDGIPLKAIYQTDLQYALMKCIQELSAKNDALEARIAALEAK